MTRLALVYNPAKIDDTQDLCDELTRRSKEHDWDEPLCLETTVEDPGAGMAAQALKVGVDVVVAAGGDGTVRAVACGLSGSGVPLVVVPAGTGNLLARNLDLPLDRDAAVDAIFAGRDEPMDLGEAVFTAGKDPECFAVMAGLGFDAQMMADAPEGLKKRFGWLAYVVSGAKHLLDRGFRVEVRVDEQDPVRVRARTVLVGNVGRLQAGIDLLPDASPHDGQLDVAIVSPHTVSDWLRLAWQVARRKGRHDKHLQVMRGREIRIRTRHAQESQLDGDLFGRTDRLDVSVRPGALVVRAPA